MATRTYKGSFAFRFIFFVFGIVWTVVAGANGSLVRTIASRRQNIRFLSPFYPKLITAPSREKLTPEKREKETVSAAQKEKLVVDAERIVCQYLTGIQGKVRGAQKFHLFGWRWHNMSLIRETKRLQKLAMTILLSQQSPNADDNDFLKENHALRSRDDDNADFAMLKSAIDYVVGFNLNGMNRVEKEVMIPFLREQFNAAVDQNGNNNQSVKEAFHTILRYIETEEQKLEELGASIEQISSRLDGIPSDLLVSESVRSEILESIVQKSNDLIECATSLLEQKNSIIIPAMTTLIPEKEQKSTISKIMFTLGVLDSRLHLVGFHEAIVDNDGERNLWQENMPSIARNMIPQWKRKQYDTRVFMLPNL